MVQTISLSFRVKAEMAEKLDRLSEETDRPRSWLLEQALGSYLETQSWQVRHIRQGLEEIRRGEGIAHEEIVEWLSNWSLADEPLPPQ